MASDAKTMRGYKEKAAQKNHTHTEKKMFKKPPTHREKDAQVCGKGMCAHCRTTIVINYLPVLVAFTHPVLRNHRGLHCSVGPI